MNLNMRGTYGMIEKDRGFAPEFWVVVEFLLHISSTRKDLEDRAVNELSQFIHGPSQSNHFRLSTLQRSA